MKKSSEMTKCRMEKHSAGMARKLAILEARKKACGQVIRKAKTVAERQAKKVLEERAAKKALLEVKLLETENRRQRLLLVPRSKLMSDDIVCEINALDKRQKSVRRIQVWWRGIKVSICSRLFMKTGLSMKAAKVMPFPVLAKKGQQDQVMKAVGRMLVRAKRMSAHPVENWQAPSRVFLSSYLVYAYPEQVFPSMGPNEEALQKAALAMLTDFEAWMSGSKSAAVLALGRSFLASWIAYYDAFNQWKSGNSKDLVTDLIKHFMELERLWISVKEQEDAEDQWKPKIQEQQKQIHVRLARLNSSALDALMEKRSKALADYLVNEPNAESRPVTMTNTSPDVYKTVTLNRRDSVTKSRSSSPSNSQTTENTPVPKQDQMTEVQNMWSNHKIAHEMIMDPEFKMKRSDSNTLEGKVAAMARKAFFDTIRDDFHNGKFTTHVPNLLKDIKEILLGMVPEKSKLVIEIQEVLDMDLIQQQIDKDSFDIEKCLSYITSKMLQLCAPVRDASIRALREETDLTSAFEKILDILEDMRFDLMNFQLESLKPHLKQQAVEYEQMKFEEVLAKGQITMDKTTAWLAKSADGLQSVQSARNPENLEHPDLKVRYESVYHDALLGLIFSTTPLLEEEMAETLQLDTDRIMMMQNEAQAITIVASLCMLSKNVVPELRANDVAMKKLKETLFILLEAADTSIDHLATQIMATVNESLSQMPRPKKLSDEQETIMKNMVEKTVSFSDAVYSLISRRMQTNIRQELEKGVFKSESLTRHGLDTVGKELETLSRKICLLAKHNKEVYVKHYDRILKSLVQ